MNRLTERKENGVINVRYATEHETAIHRLAAIEDILGDEYELDELREMAQAKREGRCVVLPCTPTKSAAPDAPTSGTAKRKSPPTLYQEREEL